jgi:hypothetical protein
MKEIYTQHTLNEFFEEFKNLPSSYKIEQVHQLLNNPDAKAMHKVKFHFKHLKLIIMTSAFIIGITTTFLWFSPKNTNIDIASEKLPENQIEFIQKDISQNPDTKNEQNLIVTDNSVTN